MAITGHKDLWEVETYTREANRKQLAQKGMGRLVASSTETEEETEAG